MKFSLNSHVLIAHWVPGFLVVMTVRSMLSSTSPLGESLRGKAHTGEAIALLSIAVAAFLVGELLDAIRDLFEHLWDKFQPLRWDFFSTGTRDEVEKFKESHFTYYVFDCNVSLALLLVLILEILNSAPAWTCIVLTIPLVIFAINAILLRVEMKPLMETK